MPLATPQLRKLREDAGYQQKAFALEAELGPDHYYNVEALRKPASLAAFARMGKVLSKALGREIDYRAELVGKPWSERTRAA